MKKPHSINLKMLSLFITVAVLQSLLSTVTLYVIFDRIIRTQILQDLGSVMDQDSWNLNTFVNSVNQASLYLCTDKTIADILSTEQADPLETTAAINQLDTEITNHIAIPLNGVMNNYTYHFFVSQQLSLGRQVPSSYSFTDSGIRNDAAVSGTGWYQQARSLSGVLYCTLTTLDNGQKALMMARSVSNPYLISSTLPDGYLGVMVFVIDLSEIARQIEPAKLTASTDVFLTDSDGIVLYSKNAKDLQSSISRYVPQSLLEGYGTHRSDNLVYGWKNYIVNVSDLKYGWRLVAMTPDSDISRQLAPVRDSIVLTSLLSIAMGVLLGLFFSWKFTTPIKKLAQTMTTIKSRDYFDIFIEPPSNDEVGVLYDSFNHMMKRIDGLLDEVLKSVRLQKEAERKALQAQINPHFLYNTLDAVNWLALCDGDETIASVISSLANIMRFSIRNLDAQVAIAEEIDNVKNYVRIQSTCHADNFDMAYDIAPEILPLKCPAMMLQPLVENAILHGIERIDGRGSIRITGALDGELVRLRVSNSGPEVDVDALNAYLRDARIPPKGSGGLGIRNVDRRIRLLFGEQYGLRFQAEEENRLAAEITLPAAQAKPEDTP